MIESADINKSRINSEEVMSDESFEKHRTEPSYDMTLCYEQFLCYDDSMSWKVAEENAERFYNQAFEYKKSHKKNANADSLICKSIVDFILSCNRSDGYVSELESGAFYILFKNNICLCHNLSDYMKAYGLSSSCQDTIWYRIAFFIDLEIYSDVEYLNDETKIDSAINDVHWKEFPYLSQHKYFLYYCIQ